MLTGRGGRYTNAAVFPFSHTLLVALGPNDPEAMTATAFAAGRKHSDAVRQFREAVQASAGEPSVRFELGLELAARSQADEAIAQMRECARLDPEHARPRAAMGAIYLNSSRAATQLDPRNAGYRSAFGEALLRQPGRIREASARSIELSPASGPAHLAMARLNVVKRKLGQ